MSKRYRETIDVTLAAEPAVVDDDVIPPAGFRWRGSTYTVLGVLGHWREDAGYWSGGGITVPQRDLWRVEARNGVPTKGVYELVCEDQQWRLDRVWD